MTVEQARNLKVGDKVVCTEKDVESYPLNRTMLHLINKKRILIVRAKYGDGYIYTYEESRVRWCFYPSQLEIWRDGSLSFRFKEFLGGESYV